MQVTCPGGAVCSLETGDEPSMIIGRSVNEKESGERATAANDRGDAQRIKSTSEAGPEPVSKSVESAHLGRRPQAERSNPRRHCEGVAVERPAVLDSRCAPGRIEYGHEFSRTAKGTDRQTATDNFSNGGQIRPDAEVALHATISNPEREHLIKNQKDPALL